MQLVARTALFVIVALVVQHVGASVREGYFCLDRCLALTAGWMPLAERPLVPSKANAVKATKSFVFSMQTPPLRTRECSTQYGPPVTAPL